MYSYGGTVGKIFSQPNNEKKIMKRVVFYYLDDLQTKM